MGQEHYIITMFVYSYDPLNYSGLNVDIKQTEQSMKVIVMLPYVLYSKFGSLTPVILHTQG